jgi:ribonucleoside-diphosphate reductase alpha chain
MSHLPFSQSFAHSIYKQRYAHEGEEWPDTAKRVTNNVLGALGYTEDSDEHKRILKLINDRQFLPGGRYLYASGRPLHQVQNCLLLKAEDSREGWAELLYKATMALQTGAGIGVDYSDVRPAGSLIKKTGGIASGPLSPMKMVNEVGREVVQGGNRRSAIWAGLNWSHPDIFDFIKIKDWEPEVRALKEKDFYFPATMDMTNVSVLLDDEFFLAINNEDHEKHEWACSIYMKTLNKMLTTAEPGFSVDVGPNSGETLRNACTEVTSRDDSDVCNLGSINMAAFHDKEQFASAVKDATLFLLAGTVYSDLPYDKVHETRSKNRRLGLGVMGIHDWLLQRGYQYEPNDELAEWLEEYEKSTSYAHDWADKHNLSRPIKTRAIAPTGTIGIIAETTTGIEPIYAVAFKRRVYNTAVGNNKVVYEYVVDPTAKRLIDTGVDPDLIEDAHVLSQDVERRISMQAFVQRYVDHGISSTINMPGTIDDVDDQRAFGDTLLKYLPHVRGITVYPEAARAGQPLTRVPLEEALGQTGVRFEEDESKCVGGVCAI